MRQRANRSSSSKPLHTCTHRSTSFAEFLLFLVVGSPLPCASLQVEGLDELDELDETEVEVPEVEVPEVEVPEVEVPDKVDEPAEEVEGPGVEGRERQEEERSRAHVEEKRSRS